MKYKKMSIIASLMLSISILTACTNTTEKTEVEKTDPEVVETTKQTDKVDTVVEKEGPKEVPAGYKVGGNETNGYILIPEDYSNFVDPNVPNGTANQYAKGLGQLIVTVQATDPSLDLKKATSIISQNLGEDVKVEEKTVAGYKTNVLYQAYPEENYHLYAYLYDTEEGVRFISIEFAGEDDGSRHEIADSYSLTPYAEANTKVEKPVDKTTEVEKEEVKKTEPANKGSKASTVAESQNANLHVTQTASNEVEFEIFGDFEVGAEYVISLYSDAQFDGLADQRFVAEKSRNEAVVSGIFKLDKDLPKAEYNLIMLHGKTYEAPTKDLFFTIK